MNWFQEGNWEDLWSPFVRTLSRGRFGREVCTLAKEELGLENIPGLEYPQPLQVIVKHQSITLFYNNQSKYYFLIIKLAWILLQLLWEG